MIIRSPGSNLPPNHTAIVPGGHAGVSRTGGSFGGVLGWWTSGTRDLVLFGTQRRGKIAPENGHVRNPREATCRRWEAGYGILFGLCMI